MGMYLTEADITQRNLAERARDARIAELEAENARLRKVADAALHYFNVDTDRADWDALAFNALDAAVREYRKELPQICHKGASPEEPKEWLLAPFVTLTEEQPDGE